MARLQGAGGGRWRGRSSRAVARSRHRACPTAPGDRDEPRARGGAAVGGRAGRVPRAAVGRGPDGAQGDGAHAGSAGPDVCRRIPRLGAAGRRWRQVRPEGRHHPACRRPLGVQAGARGRAGAVSRCACCHSALPDSGRGRCRRRCAVRSGGQRRRHPGASDGGLVERQQVRPARWHACRCAAAQLRAAVGPLGGVGRTGSGDGVADRHRQRVAVRCGCCGSSPARLSS